ncbi:sulfatase-like hydrolase/transferase [Devosia sp. XGJD_8]|uniref:sulfatase-like hydrolase/transferase n=1 Tax=Devosia sp. XGJD_8 TaxID=3391187 RepID=UPI0039852E75
MTLGLLGAASATPALNFLAANPNGTIRGLSLLAFSAAFFAALTLAALALSLLVKLPFFRSALVMSLVPFLTFSFGLAQGPLIDRPLPGAVMIGVWTVGIIALWAIFAKLFSYNHFRSAGIAFVLISATLPLFTVLGSARSSSDPTKPSADNLALPVAASASETLNVYHFVLDGYARADSLLAVLGFDNSPFIAALEERAFSFPTNTYANYPVTYLSLASTLEQRLVVPAGLGTNADEHLPFVPALRGDNASKRSFVKAGYSYAHYENGWWVQSMCGEAVDLCIENRPLLSETELTFLSNTPIIAAIKLWSPTTLRSLTETFTGGLGMIADALPLDRPGRWYTFLHVMSPHYPYEFANDCGWRFSDPSEEWREVDKPRYVNDIQCTNRAMLQIVDRIIGADPSAIILLHSDHGSAFTIRQSLTFDEWSQQQLDERLGVFAAFRLPDLCDEWLYSGISPVNFLRIVQACAAGAAQPELLPDRHFITSWTDRTSDEYGSVAEFECDSTCTPLLN